MHTGSYKKSLFLVDRVFGLKETWINLPIRTRMIKIELDSIGPHASGPLRGTAGQEGFSIFKSGKPLQGRPTGVGDNPRT